MRKVIAVVVVGLAATFAFAGATVKTQPLNAKPGLWQTTRTPKYTGLPPQMAQMTATMFPPIKFKSCLKPKDLKNLSGNAVATWLGVKCSSVTVLKSTSTDLDVQGKGCSMGDQGINTDGLAKIHVLDSEHEEGTIDAVITGLPGSGPVHLHATDTSRWIGATCPADMK
jgi:hypothetical protein